MGLRAITDAMDSFESAFLEKLSKNAEATAVLAEEMSSMRRDVDRMCKGIDKINERHESIRMSCADHCADTKMAADAARAAQEEIREHKQNHLVWYGLILAAVALFNLPVETLLKKAVAFFRVGP